MNFPDDERMQECLAVADMAYHSALAARVALGEGPRAWWIAEANRQGQIVRELCGLKTNAKRGRR